MSFAAVGSSPNGNGGVISSGVITLEPADGSNPGLVTAAAQTFAGTKTFLGDILLNSTGRIATSGTASGAAIIAINGNPLTGATQSGLVIQYTGSAAATTTLRGAEVILTQANGVTTTNSIGIQVQPTVAGSGSTLTRHTDLFADGASSHVATNNAALADSVAFTGNWFLNQAGTDPNLLTGPTAIGGTTTNDNAASGFVGQYIESVISSPASLPGASGGHWGDATSISLTAGDWEVTAILTLIPNGATITGDSIIGISSTTGDSSTGLIDGSNEFHFAGTTTVNRSAVVPSYRISLASTTTYYLKVQQQTFSVATPQYQCRLSARRMR